MPSQAGRHRRFARTGAATVGPRAYDGRGRTPPTGEPIQTRTWHESRVEHVTLVEAPQRAPFTVLMFDTVPANWEVRCRLIRRSERPPSSMQIGVIYCSTDGHESISLSQFGAGGSNPYRDLGDGEGWETVRREGTEMRTRPATWGQARVPRPPPLADTTSSSHSSPTSSRAPGLPAAGEPAFDGVGERVEHLGGGWQDLGEQDGREVVVGP